jgi:molybdenum cofactor cytidylyltransferase
VNVSAVILAAGKSTRFGGGRDKLLAELQGRTLIEHVITAAVTAKLRGVVTEVIVVAAADAPRVKSIAVADSCRVIHPQDPASGIAGSLKAGIASLAPGADGAVILLGDQPMVRAEAIGLVVKAANESPQALVRAHYRGNADQLSHPVLIGRNHFGLVHQTTADRGFQAMAEQHELRWTEVWIDGHNPDIDFAADLERLR